MFDPEKLKVGDVFYSVKERNQAFARKKIYQEIDEYRWFRYDRPLRTYEIVTYKVLGINVKKKCLDIELSNAICNKRTIRKVT